MTEISREEIETTLAQAELLATGLAEKHFPEIPQWRPLSGDLVGLILQIDNMTTALVRKDADLYRAGAEDMREAAAKMADDFHWILPMYEDAATNEATDDAACAVMEQIATAIRSLPTGRG